jgi:hypothetical protein
MAQYGVSPVLFESVSTVTATKPADLDLGTVVQSNGKEYRYVYNNGTSTIGVGYGCVITGLSGFSVTVSSTTSKDFLIGVVEHTQIEPNYYGWVCRRGCVDVYVHSIVTLADQMQMGADGTFACPTGANTSVIAGKMAEATVSAAAGKCWVLGY